MPPAKRRPAKKTAAKKTTAPKPPVPPADPPKRGRATVGPKTPPERGRRAPAKKAPAPPERGKNVPVADVKGTPTPPGKPNVLQRAAKPKEGATYHRVVLAEFIGAAVLAVVGGILSPRKRADGNPTWVHLIVQLTAICFVYFILALLSARPTLGKVAAAFGLLVLLGILMNSADSVRKMAAVFAPPKKQDQTQGQAQQQQAPEAQPAGEG